MIDNKGLLYFTEENKGEELIFNERPKKKNINEQKSFYKFIGNENLIIKYYQNEIDFSKLYKMLIKFIELNDKIYNIDFPTAYYTENNNPKGMIVPYYKNGISLYQLTETHYLPILKEHYKHDADDIHNLYLLCYDILDKLEELVDHSLLYYDSNVSNYIIINNEVKIIDFDYEYIDYNPSKDNIKKVLKGYEHLFFVLNKRFGLEDLCIYNPKSFKDMRKYVKKTENKIRKRIK